MKKSLSLLLAIALVFGMFYSVAAAATPTPAEAGQQLKDYGIIEGSNGDLMVDSTWLRQDAVVLLSRLLKAEATAKAHANDHGFTDVKGSFYNGYISWAKEEKYIKGNNAAGTTFGFDKKLSNQEFAAIILRVFGIDDYDNAVAKGIEFGILPADAKADAPATRGDTFVGIVAALDVEVPGTGKKLGAILELPGFNVAVGVAKVTATGAKKLAVEFNQAVDTEKATFTVKKGSASVNVAGKSFSDDKKTATVELATRLTEGDYTVSVSGLTDEALTATVKAADEKVSKIELGSDTLALGALPNTSGAEHVFISYKVLNQYGEDITNAGTTPGITWTASKGSGDDNNAGSIDLYTGTAGVYYNLTEPVVLTGIEQNSGTTVTATLKVGNKSSVDSVEFGSVWNANNKELNTGSTFSDFYVLLSAKDQYGNSISNATYVNSDLIITSTNPGVVQVAGTPIVAGVGPNSDQLGIQLAAPVGTGFDGTASIRAITKFGAKTFSFDVTVKKASTVDTIQLQLPSSVIASGDVAEIPYVAADQFGTDVNGFSSLDGVVTLTNTTGDATNLYFEQDYVNKKAVLKFDATGLATGKYILMAVTPSGKSSQITVEVKAARYPAVVAGTKDLVTNLVKDATVAIKDDNIVVQDQYGKAVDLNASFFSNYEVRLSANDGTADKATGFANIVADNGSITLTAAAKGTERVKVILWDLDADDVTPLAQPAAVNGSEYLFNVNVYEKADVAEYTVDDVAKVNKIDAAHAVDFNVYGKLSNGSKVVLPAAMYTVNTTINGLNYSAGKLNASAVSASYFSADKHELAGNAIVVIDTANGAQDIVKPVIVTDAALEIATVTAENAGTITIDGTVAKGAAANINVANIFGTLVFKDQYGVKFTGLSALTLADVYVTITSLDDVAATGGSHVALGVTGNGTSSAAINNVEQGDSFNISFMTQNGKTIKLRVVAQ